jgi:hypothetical protein
MLFIAGRMALRLSALQLRPVYSVIVTLFSDISRKKPLSVSVPQVWSDKILTSRSGL